jgi:hypothetical protein
VAAQNRAEQRVDSINTEIVLASTAMSNADLMDDVSMFSL